MLVDTPQIAWHQTDTGKNEPVLSCDFRPPCARPAAHDGPSPSPRAPSTAPRPASATALPASRGGHIFATAGADSAVRIWRVHAGLGSAADAIDASTASASRAEFVACLQGHSKTVNCVRWSPNGECLASASDDGRVFVWRRNPDFTDPSWDWRDLTEDGAQKMVARTMLGGHANDVHTLDWSPDGMRLVSGSIDGSAIVWDVRKGRQVDAMSEHAHYVQGVAWDPHDQYLYTQSSDRSLRVSCAAGRAALCPDEGPTLRVQRQGQHLLAAPAVQRPRPRLRGSAFGGARRAGRACGRDGRRGRGQRPGPGRAEEARALHGRDGADVLPSARHLAGRIVSLRADGLLRRAGGRGAGAATYVFVRGVFGAPR